MQHSGSGEEHSDSGVKSAGTTINKQRGEHTKCKNGYNEDVVYTVICTNLACTGIALCSRETVLIVQYTQPTTTIDMWVPMGVVLVQIFQEECFSR